MARGKAHPVMLKAQVMAELLTGSSPADVRRRYGLPERTVFQWKGEAFSKWIRSTRPRDQRGSDG